MASANLYPPILDSAMPVFRNNESCKIVFSLSRYNSINDIKDVHISVAYQKSDLNAVNRVTGLDLEYYVVVDTEALKALVDAIGGVYFDVPINMKYTDKKQDFAYNLENAEIVMQNDNAAMSDSEIVLMPVSYAILKLY